MLRRSYSSSWEAGCDEAGRGPLAGSVFCAAVVLDALPDADLSWLPMLNDSKQLTAARREELRPLIEQNTVWAVAEVTPEEIDRYNILRSSILGMQRALDSVWAAMSERGLELSHVLVDGNRWTPWVPEGHLLAVPAMTVVHGDATYMSIAAASVLAKTHRDEYMMRLAEQYPGYGWEHNMGYPTADHYAAIARLGITPLHRRTFRLTR